MKSIKKINITTKTIIERVGEFNRFQRIYTITSDGQQEGEHIWIKSNYINSSNNAPQKQSIFEWATLNPYKEK